MKLPSVQIILQDSIRTFTRFPLVLINTVIMVITAIILVDHEGSSEPTVLFNILFASIIGIPFLLSLALLKEKRRWGRILSSEMQAGVILLLIVYSFTIPSTLQYAPSIHIIRLILLVIAVHLLVVFVAFSEKDEVTGFWQFNELLLIRILTSMVFTFVLCAGLSVAIMALKNLFGIDIPGKRFPELFILVAGVFNTWYFLAGIPESLHELNDMGLYPKMLKIFTQYILLPLLVVYLVILYAYIVKILVEWELPKGWVSGLIIGYSCLGILSLLLLYPLKEISENKWIKGAWQWFFYSMIPLIIMLPIAVLRRTSQYGFTESRVIGCAVALWLIVITIYFIFSRKKNIRIIPISLCIFAILMSYGPWSIFSISERSQVERLRNLLGNNGVLMNGKVTREHSVIPSRASWQISSIISYLHDNHGYNMIQPWFNEPLLKQVGKTVAVNLEPSRVTEKMGITYSNPYFGGSGSMVRYYRDGETLDIGHYNRIIQNQIINEHVKKYGPTVEGIFYRVENNLTDMTVLANDKTGNMDSVKINFMGLFDILIKEFGEEGIHNVPGKNMFITAEGSNLKVKVYFKDIELLKSSDKITARRYSFDLLYLIE